MSCSFAFVLSVSRKLEIKFSLKFNPRKISGTFSQCLQDFCDKTEMSFHLTVESFNILLTLIKQERNNILSFKFLVFWAVHECFEEKIAIVCWARCILKWNYQAFTCALFVVFWLACWLHLEPCVFCLSIRAMFVLRFENATFFT